MKTVIKFGIVLCVLQMSIAARAADINWSNGDGDQDWFNANNWSLFTVPQFFDTAQLDTPLNPPTSDPIIDGLVDINPAVVGRLVVGNDVTLNIINGGSLVSQGTVSGAGPGQILLGNNSAANEGHINVDDGAITAGTEFAVGNDSGANGTLTVGADGVVNANGDWLILAHLGTATTGTATVNGGTINVLNAMHIGWQGTGSLTVNNGGLVSVGNAIQLGVNHPSASGSIVINSGGTVTSTGLNLGVDVGTGTLLMESGSTYTNTGSVHVSTGSTVTINGTAEYESTFYTLEEVRNEVFGNPEWIFSSAPKITGSLGSVIITNTDGTELAGDFDFDGDVDGADFLEWQHGHTVNPFSAGDLLAWETNYGMVAPAVAGGGAAVGVPEPSTALLLGGFCVLSSFVSRRRLARVLT